MSAENNNSRLLLLAEYMRELSSVKNTEDLKELSDSYYDKLSADPDEDKALFLLWKNAAELGSALVRLKSAAADETRMKRLAQLSDEEKRELGEVEKIIDNNLFIYHFQPIVSAVDGEIYSYEALMRSKSDPRITPFHILKYAELTGRLGDIEKDTFLNILRYIEESAEKFSDRPVFINSIPNTKLSPEDMDIISQLLAKNSANTVIEMTEQSEFDEFELNAIKERYRKMNVRIAIDDYGTGYSNVKNLLRYTPNYVKIDRSLLSEIQNNPQKRHFVREIIDFCHDNGILALAEGVETSAELRSVILFGVDLIQGFYTARPSPEIIESIPYEIKQEIKRYHQERQDGKAKRIYTADDSERVMLDKLVKEGYNCIKVGREGTVAVVGHSALDTDIHIEVVNGFCGTLVLEDAHLANIYQRPCIEIEKGCDITVEIKGHNKLERTGIRVPMGASVRFVGSGDSSLNIHLDSAEHYGIGNNITSAHGRLLFDQDSTITIESESQSGVLIGAGMGGDISIVRGRYKLRSGGSYGVCIGSFDGDVDMELQNCDIEAHAYGASSVALGSLNANAKVFVHAASLKCMVSGEKAVAVGTLEGESADVHLDSANIYLTVQASDLAALGSFEGSSKVLVERAVFSLSAGGYGAYAFGGKKGCESVGISKCDTSVEFTTAYGKLCATDNIKVSGGRRSFKVNGEAVEI